MINRRTLIGGAVVAAAGAVFASPIARRLWLLDQCERDKKLRAMELEMCSRSVEHFFDNWVWTFNPKLAAEGKPSSIPLDLFPRQRELLHFLDDRVEAQENGIVEKSRDIGFTWVSGGYAVHKWRFHPGFKTAFGSRKAEYVDRLGDPDSIFEKIRMVVRALPYWMLPPGYDSRRNDNHMQLLNPDNGNTIRGEAGDDMGRGGRNTMYVLDEFAFVEHAEEVDRATSANSDVRIFGSTVNGMGNVFARKRHGGHMRADQIFRFHWTDDPRKNNPEWESKTKANMEPWAFASEYDIDYAASVEGVFIPAKWVEACWRIATLPNFTMPQPDLFGVAGQDVGAGGAGKSVFVARFGPIVQPPVSWGDPDTIETAHRAIEECGNMGFTRADGHDCRIGCLNYDSVGVGVAVLNTFTRTNVHGLATQGINTGVPASERRWEDGQTSLEKFANCKAELWSIMREAVKCTFETYMSLTGQMMSDGKPYPVHSNDKLMILPDPSSGPDANTLITQLSYPRRERTLTGKIAVEPKKAMMEKRGLPSPDHADALALTYCAAELDVWAKIAQQGQAA